MCIESLSLILNMLHYNQITAWSSFRPQNVTLILTTTQNKSDWLYRIAIQLHLTLLIIFLIKKECLASLT